MRKLVFIYGAPAVGKLTVGRLLAKDMQATLFHNHMAYDLAMELLASEHEFSTVRHFACRLRLYALTLLFEESQRDIVTTFCYEGSKDDRYIEDIRSACGKHRITPFFVQLRSDRENLLKQVESPDRRRFGKMDTQAKLKEILKQCDYSSVIEAAHHRTFHTSLMSPQKIVDHLLLWFSSP
ncbi:AAA family ATPase [Erwinia tracheiphila]|uniref:AAA family ATPase n=1 Tax=Erwinia tracheiphila TaxID=65700 RepID=A0A345CTK6_9GAMM|nr:AAA family ATPase [Erwinia tracheiphila]AXF76773.1 AAA family ATPase [Erwinia tracheiphila]UIA84546.1 AAA family ATPase [Erwinia tracheiphila]UIA93139.1 AAA family ATPase [Erwinia tracheiphila]